MQKDITAILAQNDRAFYKNNMISKNELEKRVTPYLEKYNITFSSFLAEETVRRIASRKKARQMEKVSMIATILVMILGLYAVGYSEGQVHQAEILAYNYR